MLLFDKHNLFLLFNLYLNLATCFHLVIENCIGCPNYSRINIFMTSVYTLYRQVLTLDKLYLKFEEDKEKNTTQTFSWLRLQVQHPADLHVWGCFFFIMLCSLARMINSSLSAYSVDTVSNRNRIPYLTWYIPKGLINLIDP